ncbi:hypothetical protein P879_01536 [Paragonimus westermani]|uniref:TLC domain-containing protein n=1 Tax=Paragonimus westermani TaxID=34504 RepID=A0A8T0DXV1_9TREM|nr:hypothetical protein P879_01536 [Paragonimus westermani]
MSAGYFVHDIYHNICGGLCFRSSEIIIHHVAVVTCFSIVMTYRLLLPYALCGLLMELNSIFLHGRQIMLYLDISPESFWYRMNYKANIVSFIIFRLMLSTGLYIWAILHRSVLPKLHQKNAFWNHISSKHLRIHERLVYTK